MPLHLAKSVLAILTLMALPGAAWSQDDNYQWMPLFDADREPVYHECSLLQRQVADRERERSEAHQRCLDEAARRSSRGSYCKDDPFSGCTCRDCAPFHGADNYMQLQLEGCMQRARQAAEQRRQEEQRRAELDRAVRAFGDAVGHTLQEDRQPTTSTPKASPSGRAPLPAPEYDPLRPGSRPPPTYRPPIIELPTAPPGRYGAAPTLATTGERLAAAMPTFDDLTRAGAAGADRVKVPAVAAQVAADHWDPAFGGALRAATDAVDGANQLIDWARFVASSSQPLSEQERSDRTLFALGELGGRALPAVSSYSFTAAIGTLQNVQNDLSRRLDLSWRAWDGDSADPWGDIDRASEFSTLGVLISTSMCPWCERAINTEAVIREAWSEMSRRLGIR